MIKRNIFNKVLIYTIISVFQVVWIPIGIFGMICSGISRFIEMSHWEFCILVSSLRSRVK